MPDCRARSVAFFSAGYRSILVPMGRDRESEEAVDLAQNGGGIETDGDYTAAVDGMPGTESLVYVDVQGVLGSEQQHTAGA